MTNKNIQMKKREGNDWDNLFPITLSENVFNSKGLNLNEQLDNMNSVIDQKLANLADEQENTNANINNLEKDMNNTFKQYDEVKDEKYIDVKNNPYYNAIGDGESHKISDIFPEVTLEEVTKLNSNATLESSADWFAIQSLMDEALKQGKEVFISSGDYIIDHPLLFESYTRISGQGRTSILRSRVVNDFVLRHRDIHSNDGRAEYISIKSFYILGTGHVGSGGGLHFRHGGHMSIIKDMWIKYFRGSGQVSLKLTRTWYVYIQNCDLSNSNNGIILGEDDGEYMNHVVNNVTIRDCKIYGILQYDPKTYGSIGVQVNMGVNNVITGCQIEGWTTGIIQRSRAYGTVYSDSYSEDITYRHLSDLGSGFRVFNITFIHIASNNNTTMLHLSNGSNGGTFENLIFRNIDSVDNLFDDRVSKNTTFKNLQAIHSESYVNGISTEDIYDKIPSNVTGIGYKQDESTTGITHVNKTISFDQGISLPQVSSSPSIKNSLYVNKNGELTFYDGTSWKKVSLVD